MPYLIHDSALTAYAESVGQTTTALDKTIGDPLSVHNYRELVEAIGFVPEKATVADARAVTANIKNCNDVFVTASGKCNEPHGRLAHQHAPRGRSVRAYAPA